MRKKVNTNTWWQKAKTPVQGMLTMVVSCAFFLFWLGFVAVVVKAITG